MRLKNKIVNGILTLILLISVQALANTDEIWKRHPDYIVVTSTKGGQKFSHPAQLSAEKLARVLSQIEVKGSSYRPEGGFWSDDDSNVQRLFTDKEIDLLANKISMALSSLSPEQMIVFSISDYRSTVIGRKQLSVSGSVFLKDGRLNILLGEVHVDLQTKQQALSGVTGYYGRVKNTLSNGDPAKPVAREWQLIAFPGSENFHSRKDWLSIDLSKEYEFQTGDSLTTTADEKYFTQEQRGVSNKNLDARIRKLEAEQEEEPESKGSIETRLKKLQSLYESGVLPESVYLEKVKLIMREL